MDDLGFGLQVTVVGFGLVLGVLATLWLLLSLALRLERRSARSAAVVTEAGHAEAGDLDPTLVAAISVAVLRHAEARRRQAAPEMRSYWPGSLLFASRWVGAGRTRQARSWRRAGR
jgi:hypothetical protein